MNALNRLIDTIENEARLDGWSKRLRPIIDRVTSPTALRDVLTGRLIGHPLHPAGVIVPMSCWFGATALDLVGGRSSRAAAQRLVGLGVLSAAPVALSGAADWLDTDGAEQRVGTAHAIANNVATGLFATSWVLRRRGNWGQGRLAGLAAAAVTGASAFLGGHLTYRRGVGVDTTAFQSGPQDWQQVHVEADDSTGDDDRATPGLVGGRVGGIDVAVIRDAGAVRVMEARCTHRGGPLHEGRIVAGCIECPWHASRFDVVTGAVRQGPASAPQRMLAVRETDGRLEARQDEPGGLRRNPIGATSGD